MYLTLKQLRYYDAAIRTGSIARAAAEMNISQSSITAAIDTIEQQIGQELFRRVPARGLQSTDTGRAVGARIALFLDQARIFESDLMSISGDTTGTLHLGCYSPTAPHMLPPLMKALAKEHPSIRVDLVETDLNQMTDLLQQGKIDMALTYRTTIPETMPFVPLIEARPWALVPDNSPLEGKSAITLEELSKYPLVLLDLPAVMSYFQRLFSEHKLTPTVSHTTKSSSVLRGLVAAGFGHSVLNICSASDRSGENGYYALPITGDVIAPLFGVAFTHAAGRSALVQAVLGICQELSEQGAFDKLILRP